MSARRYDPLDDFHVDRLANTPAIGHRREKVQLAREVQELRHLRQELDIANAYLADCRKLIADLRALPYTFITTDFIRQMVDGAGT